MDAVVRIAFMVCQLSTIGTCTEVTLDPVAADGSSISLQSCMVNGQSIVTEYLQSRPSAIWPSRRYKCYLGRPE